MGCGVHRMRTVSSIRRVVLCTVLPGVLLLVGARVSGAPGQADAGDDLTTRAVATLRRVMGEEEEWVKVHAAEMLVYNNYLEGVREAFEAELDAGPGPKYRIGVWRVLARAAGNDAALRRKYVDEIVAAFADKGGPDRLHAVETLGKLGHADVSPELRAVAESGEGTFRAYARWVVANSGEPEDEAFLADLLSSPDADVKGCVAYALRFSEGVSDATLDKLLSSARAEAGDSGGRVYLLSAAYVHASKAARPEDAEWARTELLTYAETGDKGQKNEVCSALGTVAGEESRALLAGLLDDPEADVQAHAAHALIRIGRRQFRGLGAVDWCVIVLYALFMVGVGLYYSRRQTSTEEYFLASRNMSSTLVGISMFATLLSTISYLSVPGEMIKHGPVVLCGLLATPFVYLVVSYFLIPRLMRLEITSAYELLETRLGAPVRVVGAVIFIMTRLVWMALLVYIAAKLMVEMLNWSEALIPWVVLAAGLIAVLYTAVGGLRAVVVTDLYQFFILMAGAVITVVLISVRMGGLGWFPTAWAPNWDQQPLFSWNISTRATVVGALIGTFCWWVCTAGSDQVAIQRYLATRDTKSARRAFLINLVANFLIMLFLAVVGFALLGFFRANPHLIPDGKNLIANADYLFPRYIANYLPVGFAGLVVAGMFAAAMSSLDSGINSIVTVVSRDFVQRFRRQERPEADGAGGNVKTAKILVLFIGLAVVLLSSQMGKVPGNITEVTNKTNGLFVGPLFGLFFMALFMRRSTGFGAVIGAVYGFMVAFAFAYWEKITGAAHSLSFQLIIPAAVGAHIAVGALASRVPTKGKRLASVLGMGVVAVVPLVVFYVCLCRWGLAVAKALNLGMAG